MQNQILNHRVYCYLIIHSYFSGISWKITSQKDKQQKVPYFLHAQIKLKSISNIINVSLNTIYNVKELIDNMGHVPEEAK